MVIDLDSDNENDQKLDLKKMIEINVFDKPDINVFEDGLQLE